MISFEWTERETVRYTNRITVDRDDLQKWMEGKIPGSDPESIDADELGWYLSERGLEAERSNREVDPATEFVDLEIVEEKEGS